MFHKSILQVQEELKYHKNQQEKLEQQLYRLKSYEEFASQAYDNVKETIEQVQDPQYLELFKEGLLSLFPTQTPNYLREEDDIEYMDDSHPDYKSIEQLQEEDPVNIAVFHSEEYLEEQAPLSSTQEKQGITPHYTNEEQKESKTKTWAQLTGRPDLRPTTYEDITPNITYSSDGRCYVGFNDYKEAESFRESISEPAMISDAEIMNGFKYEVKFYCDREYVQQFVEAEQETKSDFEQIGDHIIYNHNDSIAYVGMSAKGRANDYGSYLTRILDIAEKYMVSTTPQIIKDSKYELRLEDIDINDAVHLGAFNLKRPWDHPDNREVREVWRTTRKREIPSAYKPTPKPTPLDEIKLGDIVTTDATKIKDKQYKVIAKKELKGVPHVAILFG